MFSNSLLLNFCEALTGLVDQLGLFAASLFGLGAPLITWSDICVPLFGPGF